MLAEPGPPTHLKPDYYDYFPIFGEAELCNRLDSYPPWIATLLDAQNMVLASRLLKRNLFAEFAELTTVGQRNSLLDVLTLAGMPEAVCRAMGAVDRQRFLPPGQGWRAYLNMSVPLAAGSCLTAPGLVAAMLSRLPSLQAGSSVLELGLGSGYHAACVQEVYGKGIRMSGVEASSSVMQLGRANLCRNGYAVQAWTAPPAENVGLFDLIYCTYAHADLKDACLALREGGCVQGPRALTSIEYAQEPKDSWLQRRYESYEAYREGNWREFMCLETARLESGALQAVSRLYDVTFVERLSTGEE